MSIQYKALDRYYGRQSWNGLNDNSRNTSILACSMDMTMYRPHQLCADRKDFFAHLHPKSLTKSSIRIVIMQASTVMTQYMNDQLKEDMKRDELVANGKMSPVEAEVEATKWADREWIERWSGFPRKVLTAFQKYHSIIVLMRLYERVADSLVDNVTLDSLTLDTFDYAKRSSREGNEGTELGRDTFGTSLKANFISYLADFSVHEVILLYGYYVYVQEQRRRNKKRLEPSSEEEIVAQGMNLAMTLTKNSTLLLISRAIGLVLSSFGAAVGTTVLPGWGTLLGANIGDGLAMAISDEVITLNPPVA